MCSLQRRDKAFTSLLYELWCTRCNLVSCEIQVGALVDQRDRQWDQGFVPNRNADNEAGGWWAVTALAGTWHGCIRGAGMQSIMEITNELNGIKYKVYEKVLYYEKTWKCMIKSHVADMNSWNAMNLWDQRTGLSSILVLGRKQDGQLGSCCITCLCWLA